MTLRNLKRPIRIGIPLIMVALFVSVLPRTAEAGYYRHHYGYRSHYGHYGHYGGYRHGYYGHHGYRYSPYYSYGDSYYRPRGGLDRQAARLAGLGALDLSVRPRKGVGVYLDGKHIGVVGDFDGYPSYLWLKEGTYQLVFYRDGYMTVVREYTIHPGAVVDVELRMERGRSVPPEKLVAGLAEDRSEDGHESS